MPITDFLSCRVCSTSSSRYLRRNLSEPFGEVFDGMATVPEAYGLFEYLTTIIGGVCRVGSGVVTVEDAVLNETFENTLSWLV